MDAIDFKKDWEDQDEYTTEAEATFVFADKARKKVRISEYWGYWDVEGDGRTVPIVASWIGDTLVRLEENPFAHKKLPFSAATYMPVIGKFHGQPDAALLKENQESIGKMTRAYHDITSTKAIGQKLTMEDTFGSQAEWDAYDKGNDARYRPGVNIQSAIHQTNVNPVDPAVFQVIQVQQQDAESLTGNATYNKGVQGNSTASATGIKTATTSSDRRELSLLRRLTALYKDMIKQDIANMQAFASPEEVVRVTNEEYVTVKIEDIQGEYDILIDVSTPAKDKATADTLAFIIQAAGDTVDPAIKNMVLGDIIRLNQRPDLAKQIEEFQPQPSEAQVKMEQLQMAKMEADLKLTQMQIEEVAKRMQEADSRIGERAGKVLVHEADAQLNMAKVEETVAKTELIQEQTDEVAQRFLENDGSTLRDRQVEDLVYKEEMKAYIADQKNKTMLVNPVSGEKN